MIKENEPLPEHTKLDYWECYAKVVLEELYPDKFVNLIIDDKPDLQSQFGECGIEVTIARDEDQVMAEKLYCKISYNKIRDKENAIKRIEKCGAKLVEGSILSGKRGIDSFEMIINSFNRKLKKLNASYYKMFNKNDLFIFSDIYCDDIMVREAMNTMIEKQKEMKEKIFEVFVLIPSYCYCLNLKNSVYSMVPINHRKQIEQANKARDMVVVNENEGN